MLQTIVNEIIFEMGDLIGEIGSWFSKELNRTQSNELKSAL